MIKSEYEKIPETILEVAEHPDPVYALDFDSVFNSDTRADRLLRAKMVRDDSLYSNLVEGLQIAREVSLFAFLCFKARTKHEEREEGGSKSSN